MIKQLLPKSLNIYLTLASCFQLVKDVVIALFTIGGLDFEISTAFQQCFRKNVFAGIVRFVVKQFTAFSVFSRVDNRVA